MTGLEQRYGKMKESLSRKWILVKS